MLNTFFNAAVCRISDLLPFQGPNFSFFLSFSPAHQHTRAHTHTHTHRVLFLSSNFSRCPSMQVWRTKHSTNDTVTSYTITFISLLRTKKFLDKHSHLDCHVSLDVIELKGINVTDVTGHLKGLGSGAKGEMW